MTSRFKSKIQGGLARVLIGAMLSSLSLAGMVSCQDELCDPSSKGREIRFGASTGYGNGIATRTEYSGNDELDRQVMSLSKWERIDWVSGFDQIRILCEQASANGPTADYDVVGPTKQGQKSVAGIEPASGNGLQWGEGTHHFYAMYPVPGMSSNYSFTDNNPVSESNAVIEPSADNGATVTGRIPSVQEAVLVGDEFKANMNYAYMYAAATAEPNGADVSLEFKPLVTTVEFTFLTPADGGVAGKLTSVSLSSSSTPLCGSFSAAISAANPDNPAVTVSGTGNEVSVTLPGGGVQLRSDEAYKVTLLTLPVAQTDLTLTMNFEGGVKRTLELKDNGTFITIPARKKVYIRNLNVPGRFETEPMQMVIMSNATVGRTFRIPFEVGSTLPTKIIIDWGDSSEPETYAAGTAITASSVTHTYADTDDGDHTITITSNYAAGYDGALIPDFNFSTSTNNRPAMLKGLPTPILKSSTEAFARSFKDCINLESICQDLFKNNPGCIIFDSSFMGCTALTSIPAGLFDYNTIVTNFNGTFSDCSRLTSIPAGLFDNNAMVTSFQETFYKCIGLTSIPAGLFDNNPEVVSFLYTFRDCLGIVGPIPEGLFDNNTKVKQFAGTFQNCQNLVGPIPEGLFDNNTKVTTFSALFQSCYNLDGTIPTGLFDNNPEVQYFSSTFAHCNSLSGAIPEGLFDNNLKVQSFSNTFGFCNSLSGAIPAGLFDYNTKNTSFSSTFESCSNLVGPIPEGLFDNNPEVTTFMSTFKNCTKLNGAIPSGLFDNNTKVTSFNSTFAICSSLVGPIPEGLFENNPEVTGFSGTFTSCRGLTSIPTGLFDGNPKVTTFSSVFAGCAGLTSIPAGLFDNNTKVTNFNGVFSSCSSLTSIPTGLFDKNTEVTNFSSAFSECYNLQQIPGGLFANNFKVTSFQAAFRTCKSLSVIDDVFIKVGVSDPTNRFAGVTKVDFSMCFENAGVDLTSRGTAPDLWNYTLPGSVTSRKCFAKNENYIAEFTNQADIPVSWR